MTGPKEISNRSLIDQTSSNDIRNSATQRARIQSGENISGTSHITEATHGITGYLNERWKNHLRLMEVNKQVMEANKQKQALQDKQPSGDRQIDRISDLVLKCVEFGTSPSSTSTLSDIVKEASDFSLTDNDYECFCTALRTKLDITKYYHTISKLESIVKESMSAAYASEKLNKDSFSITSSIISESKKEDNRGERQRNSFEKSKDKQATEQTKSKLDNSSTGETHIAENTNELDIQNTNISLKSHILQQKEIITRNKIKGIFESINSGDLRATMTALNGTIRSDDDINRYSSIAKAMSQARNSLAEGTTKLYNFMQGEKLSEKELGDAIRNIHDNFSKSGITNKRVKKIYEKIKENPSILSFGKSTQD